MPKLTKIFIDNIPSQKGEKIFWDDTLIGFGYRVQNNARSWIIKYRNAEGRTKKLTLGNANILAPNQARQLAQEKLAEVIQGKDPASDKIEARKALTIAELCEWYMQEGTHHKKASTLQIDRGRIETHIKPLIGTRGVKTLNRGDIEKFMYDIIKGDKIRKIAKSDKKRGVSRVTGGETAASRTVQLLGAILEFARRRELIEFNPAHGIKKPAPNKKDVFLTIEEIEALGGALREAKRLAKNKTVIDAVKLLLLTGCRRNEVLTLKWEYVDFKNKCFRFPDTKTGKQTRPFGQGALNLLLELESHKKSEWVFPSSDNVKHLVGLPRTFKSICSMQDVETSEPFLTKEISLHTLRHSFASVAADMGFTELTIAGLLGHSLGGVTNRYSHNVDSSLISAADKISLRIENALNGKTEEENKVLEFKRS
ncbi:MAG: tyrosine-type recombinase/integrase [Alphaproteobacteria bacterium]